jgi:mono/diheme cytochrome c family protein
MIVECGRFRGAEKMTGLVWQMQTRSVARLPAGSNCAGAFFSIVVGGLVLMALSACDVERRQSDAELGLNPQQAAGRKIYDAECDRCHEPYSTKGKKGPGLKGVFQGQYLPLSGLPANDDRVSDIIRQGRKEMPGYSQKLSQQELQDLLAYMHTL